MINTREPAVPAAECHDSKTGPESTTPKLRAIKRVYLNRGSPQKFQRNKVQLKVAAEQETKKITAMLGKKT